MVLAGEPGGRRMYAHAHRLVDLKPGIDSQEVHVMLRRGATVTGHVVGPEDQPIRDASIFSRAILDPRQRPWTTWTVPNSQHGRVRNGRFEIHGLDPENKVPVYLLEPRDKLGATVMLTGKSAAGGPITVRLQPCGAAKMRIVGPDGKPVVGRLATRLIQMVVTPGPTHGVTKEQAGFLLADEADLSQMDPVNYKTEVVPDAEGCIRLPVLIPGATYRFIDYTAANRDQTGAEVRKEFTVEPGQKLDLGDIRIAKPPN
jgi:hypothetical protein